MRSTLLIILLCVFCSLLVAAENTRSGVIVRDTQLRAEPSMDAGTTASVAKGAGFASGQRKGLWMQVKMSNGSEGWIRLTEVRLNAAARKTQAATPAPTSSDDNAMANLSRSLGSLLGNEGPDNKARKGNIGIRGLTVSDLENAAPDPVALAKIAAWRAQPTDAQAFASAGGLSARALPEDSQ